MTTKTKKNIIDKCRAFADLTGINLTDIELCHRNMEGVLLIRGECPRSSFFGSNLHYANLTGANLIEASFYKTSLHYANFTEADLTGADFSEANLSDANFTGANLTDADFSGADPLDFLRINFMGANLTHADLSGLDLTDANFEGACLTGTKLYGSTIKLGTIDLSKVKY